MKFISNIFYDSIAPILQGLIPNETIKLLDIGAGAGFPSLPMKILYPQLDVTIIDSLNKRINFLQLLAQELYLDGVHFYHGRAEDFAQDKNFRAQYDFVTARAVARMQVLSELTIPYLKVSGKLLALKASNAPEELLEAKNALNLLFSKVGDNLSYALPNGDPRYITVVEKKKETPNKYPRKAGMPNKRPSLNFLVKNIYKVRNFCYTITSKGFLMSSREVTKTQKYLKLFKV